MGTSATFVSTHPATTFASGWPSSKRCSGIVNLGPRGLSEDHLLVLAGQYAQAYYLGLKRKKTLTETVQAYDEYLPRCLPVPHPS